MLLLVLFAPLCVLAQDDDNLYILIDGIRTYECNGSELIDAI